MVPRVSVLLTIIPLLGRKRSTPVGAMVGRAMGPHWECDYLEPARIYCSTILACKTELRQLRLRSFHIAQMHLDSRNEYSRLAIRIFNEPNSRIFGYSLRKAFRHDYYLGVLQGRCRQIDHDRLPCGRV